jgi:putative hemolysin
MIKIASYEGVIEKEQNVIHEKVFYFSDKKARHLMTHRRDIEWIDLDKLPEELEKDIQNIKHSKVICCNGNIDNFQGVLYIKDYYKALHADRNIKITDLLIHPIIIPENVNAQKVLNQFRHNQTHLCFVVNEYGGFEGIITLYDIMENIVGDIPDEGEFYEPDIFVREDKSVLVSGDAPIEALVEIIDDFVIDFEKIDYSTVAGFVFNKINKIPQVGDQFDYLGYSIEVVDNDGNRIDKLLIKRKKK